MHYSMIGFFLANVGSYVSDTPDQLFFLYYMGYCVAVRILDRLDAITKRVGA